MHPAAQFHSTPEQLFSALTDQFEAACSLVTDLRARLQNQAQWLSYPSYDLHVPIAEAYATHVPGGSSTGSSERFSAILRRLETLQTEVTRLTVANQQRAGDGAQHGSGWEDLMELLLLIVIGIFSCGVWRLIGGFS